ncbi:TRAF3-interacting protein 1 [Bacillus rossius redtenbacheri]|uniref:TRAF3-interacting protein 1 n=1 Tax=Bacillus rossius redtenbacheri TaxID=93214 RepID=UPI002FDD858C
MSEDIKPEVIKRTQDILGKFVKKPQLMDKFLKKPPFRFLHDIVTAVIRETGFLKGLFTPDEMNCETFKDRESKVLFLQKLIDAVKAVTSEPLTARPSKIVAGQEPTKTNELLQAIGKALTNNLSSAEYVEQIKSGKSGKPTLVKSKSTVGAKAAGQAQSKERARVKDVDKSDKKTVSSKVHGSESKSTLSKDDKKELRVVKEKKQKSGTETKFTNVGVKKDEKMRSKPSHVKDEVEIVNVNVQSLLVIEKKSPEFHTEKQIDNVDNIYFDKENKDISSKNAIKDTPELEENVVSVEKDTSTRTTSEHEPQKKEPVEMVRRPLSALGGRKPSAKGVTGLEGSGDAVQNELEQAVSNLQSGPDLSIKQVRSEPLEERAKPMLAEELKAKRPMSAVRPTSARRSARPASARPAAPRIRDRGEVVVVEETPVAPGRVKVIPEGELGAEMEDEGFVVLEAQVSAEEQPRSLTPELREHGRLVEQILETQKELEERGLGEVPGVEREAGQRRERELERLRASIQTLTRAAWPLGKLLDLAQEDVEAMQRELVHWRGRKQTLLQELHQAQAQTERSLQPLRLRLQDLQAAIDEQRDLIHATKASVLHNDERIAKLLTPS